MGKRASQQRRMAVAWRANALIPRVTPRALPTAAAAPRGPTSSLGTYTTTCTLPHHLCGTAVLPAGVDFFAIHWRLHRTHTAALFPTCRPRLPLAASLLPGLVYTAPCTPAAAPLPASIFSRTRPLPPRDRLP